MNKITNTPRRNFLKKTAAFGAIASTGLSLSRSAHAAGSGRIKAALIGCGGRGTGAACNLLEMVPDAKLTAVADLFMDRANRALKHVAKLYPTQIDVPKDHVFDGFDAYKKAIATDIDYVILATPPGFRPEQYLAAVQGGKHVFQEKPVCVDAPGYRTVMRANQLADERGLKMAVGLQRRHSKRYKEMIPKLHDGQIGKILFMRCYWNCGMFGSGYPGQPDTANEMEWQIRNWNHFCWLSGDNIVEQHVHNIDVCNWIMKDAHPVEANGTGGRQVRKKSNMYDHHFVEFTYENGTKMYSQARQIIGCWNKVNEYAHGSKGTVELGTNGSDGYQQEHANLASAIINGTKLNDGWHAANSTMTGILGRMATHSGKVVTWDQALNSKEKLGPDQLSFDAKPPLSIGSDGFYPVDLPGVYKVD